MDDKNQLEWALWKPFTTSEAWTTYLLPGLANTLKAAALVHGDRPSARRALRHRAPLRPPVGAGPGRRGGRVLPGDPGPAADAVRQRALRPLRRTSAASTVRSTRSSPAWCSTTPRSSPRSSGPASSPCPRARRRPRMAIGLRKGQTMTSILLPQAVTAMLPAIVSQLVVIVKDTALGGVMIGFTELLNAREHARGQLRQRHPQLHRGGGHLHRRSTSSSPASRAGWRAGCGAARSRRARCSAAGRRRRRPTRRRSGGALR